MLLQLNNITKTYRTGPREVRAVDDVTLGIDVGEFVSVQGPSGCGKSTLLAVAGGLLAPDSGEVLIAGENPYAVTADDRARFRAKQIGFVFQQFHLVPYLSVLENVLAAAMATGLKDAKPKAEELLSRFGMQDRLHHVPGELSTGERQRAALARALLNDPPLILADEPTGNLDSANAELVLKNLAEASKEAAVLLVTHDERAQSFAGRTERILDGRLVVDR